jgi:P pilus assembly chaperone PapD
MKKIIRFSLFVFLLFPSLLWAQAQVFPTHLTLTEEAPSSYVNLKNTNEKPQKYRIELVQFLMNKDGSMSKSEKVSSALADILKFSPKEIEVAPNEKQVVRVMATSFDNLGDGENYIYLHFLPEADTTETEKGAEKSKGGKFNLQAKVAVAVPVVVRKGVAKFEGKLQNLKATTEGAGDLGVNFKLANASKFFLTGDLEVIGVTEKSEVPLSKVIGLSSYIPERAVSTKIAKDELNKKLAGEPLKKIKVRYVSNAESAAPFELQSDADITAPGKAEKKSKKTSKRR